MLDAKDILNLMHKAKSESDTFSKSDFKTFKEALDSCNKYVKNNSKKSSAVESNITAREASLRLIEDFVEDYINENKVEGYTEADGVDRLRKDLIDEILNYKCITELMERKDVGEIRINSYKTIYYESHGKIYRFDKGFNSVDELQKVLEKLLGDSKTLNKANRFVNSRTPENYRINATDKSISPIRTVNQPNGDYTAVIRKFKKAEDKLKIEDIIGGKSLSDNMANLLKTLVQARFSFLTVGGTGSGKTVTNEIIISHINPMDRQVYIENPVEMSPGIEAARLYFDAQQQLVKEIESRKYNNVDSIVKQKVTTSNGDSYRVSVYAYKTHAKDIKQTLETDFPELEGNIGLDEDTGIFLNDFIQMEANSDFKDPKPTDPTPNNLIENALRQTPVWIIMGETRSDMEFKALLKAAQTGHKVVTTYHAENPEDAVRRYLMAYMAEAGNVPAELVLQNICEAFSFIINVEKLPDGSRKVMYITEIVGSEGLKPKLKNIYEFDIERVDDDRKIIGRHKRVGTISKDTVYQLRKMGVPDNKFKLYLEPTSDDEVETYLGKE